MMKIFIRFLSMAFTISLLLMTVVRPVMAQEKIKIGAVLPLAEVIGKDAEKSMKLAVKQINAAGGLLGRQMELIIIDDEMKPDKALAAVEKLANSDKVDIFVGGIANATTMEIVPALKKYKKVTVWSGASSAKVEKEMEGQNWFFHLQSWDYQLGAYYEKLWREVIQKYPNVKRKKILVAYKEDPFGSDSYSVGKPTADVYRNVMQGEVYKGAVPGGSDYLPMLKRARQFGPDVYIWDGTDKDAKPMLEDAKNIGFAPAIYLGTPLVWPADFSTLTGSDGVMFYSYWHESMKSKNKASRDYGDAFSKEFKESPATYFGPLAYTNIMIVAEAIKRAGTLESEALIKALEATKYESPLGDTFTFIKSMGINHQTGANPKLMQWQGGKIKVIWPWEFATGKLIYPFPAQGFNKAAALEEEKKQLPPAKPAAPGKKKQQVPAAIAPAKGAKAATAAPAVVLPAKGAKPAAASPVPAKSGKVAAPEEKKQPAPAIVPPAKEDKPAATTPAAKPPAPPAKSDKVPAVEEKKQPVPVVKSDKPAEETKPQPASK